MTPPRAALEWASEWDRLERCPHAPPHDNEEEYPSAAAYDACLAEFFIAFAAEQVAQARAEERAWLKEVLLSKPMGRQALWVAHDAIAAICART